MRGDFAYGEDRLVLDNLVAYGGAIGVTGNGVADLVRDRLDLQWTIVPAYALNSILGVVPVIGPLLLGGEGQGLFAANYRIGGRPAGLGQSAERPRARLSAPALPTQFRPGAAGPAVARGGLTSGSSN